MAGRWQAALGATADCVPVIRLAVAELAAADAAHVAGCARCQAERRLWLALDDEGRADEGAAAAWVARETARRLAPGAPAADGRPRWRRRWALAAAGLAMSAAGLVLMLRPPAPVGVVDSPSGPTRAVTVEITSPIGVVAAAPAELAWKPVTEADDYAVQVTEVDGTELWRADSRAPRATLPESVVRAALPGKTLEWRVTARGRDGRVIATSGPVAFRVAVTGGAEEQR